MLNEVAAMEILRDHSVYYKVRYLKLGFPKNPKYILFAVTQI